MRRKREVDLHLLLRRYSDAVQYIMDRDTGKYLLVTRGFARLLGYSQEEILSGRIKPIVNDDCRERLGLLAQPRGKSEHNKLEIKLLGRSGKRKDVELTLRNIQVGGRRLQIGSMRDIGEIKRLRKQLNYQTRLQTKKAIEVAKATLIVYQLNEKIKSTPKLSSLLLEADSEKTLLERATKLLTDPDGLNYRDVVFYIQEGDWLVPKSWSVRAVAPR